MNKIAFYCTKDHPKYKESVAITDSLSAELLTNSDIFHKNNILALDQYSCIFAWYESIGHDNQPCYYLSLLDKTNKYKKYIYIDYIHNNIAGKKAYKFNKHDSLPKAMGLANITAKDENCKINILDGTAGFTLDSFALLMSTFRKNISITLLEQSSIIYLLIKDALNRLGLSDIDIHKEIYNRVKVVNIDFISYVSSDTYNNCDDIIYLDPMFYHDENQNSHIVNKAKPKKNMQLLQNICFNPTKTEDLLARALVKAKNKVILKRNSNQSKLLKDKINYSVESKQVRYDVYLTPI